MRIAFQDVTTGQTSFEVVVRDLTTAKFPATFYTEGTPMLSVREMRRLHAFLGRVLKKYDKAAR